MRSITRIGGNENRSDQQYNAIIHIDLDLVNVEILSLDLIR